MRPRIKIAVNGGTSAVTKVVEAECIECMFYEEDECKRYPKPIPKMSYEWCGEFRVYKGKL